MRQAESDGDLGGSDLEGREREGDGATVFVFDDQGEVVTSENRSTQIEYLGEFASGEAVIDVAGDEELQLAVGGGTSGAAAINEVFLDATNFGDVVVSGHDIIVGKNDVQKSVRVGAKGGDEGGSGY